MANEFKAEAGENPAEHLESCCFCRKRPRQEFDGSVYRIYCPYGCNVAEADLKGAATDAERRAIIKSVKDEWNKNNIINQFAR